MNDNIKTMLREYLDARLENCEHYMQTAQDYQQARMCWNQGIGAVQFAVKMAMRESVNLAGEIQQLYIREYQSRFIRALFSDMVE